MKRTRIAAAVVAAAMFIGATSASAADETRATQTDIAVCAKVSTTSYPTGPTTGCGPSVFTGPGDLGTFGTADNPLGVFVHVQAMTGEGVSGPVTVTVTGASGSSIASGITGPTNTQGRILLPVGALGPGTYTVTVEFAGSTFVTGDGSTITYEPSEASGTFTLKPGR